jgi:2-polyprenyl-6-methoxyphenol hydroxylase-like FAD-dependent oxidoreductase
MSPDLLIAGGGIAGSSLAILLGRQGCTVELYERSRFPREKPCGEGLLPAGVAVLRRLGLAEEAGGWPFVGVRYHSGEETAEGRFPARDGLPACGRGQRRLLLDQLLFAAAARTPGVRAHAGASVSSPLVERGRVTGLVVDGKARRAGLVVAADGSNSRLRHQLDLDRPSRGKRFGVRAHFRLAPPAETSEWVEVFLGGSYELYVTPLPGREMLVAALSGTRSLDRKLEEQFLGWCREHRRLAERLRGAEQISQLLSARLGARARSGIAPGIVLLGDAAGSPDPITGSGMTQALLSSELLAGELSEGFTGDEATLQRFERRRRAMFRDAQRLTRLVLALAKRPRLARLAFRLLREKPEIFSHLLDASGGLQPLLGLPASHRRPDFPSHVPGTMPPASIPRACRRTP